jgi:hypothetical protein
LLWRGAAVAAALVQHTQMVAVVALAGFASVLVYQLPLGLITQ